MSRSGSNAHLPGQKGRQRDDGQVFEVKVAAPTWSTLAPQAAQLGKPSTLDLGKLVTTDTTTTYTVTAGTLPPGMSLRTDGVVTGTPTAGGSYAATVTATNTGGSTDTQLTYDIQDKPHWDTLPAGIMTKVNEAFATLDLKTYLHSVAPATIAVDPSTPLPTGLTMVNGVIDGIPTATGDQMVRFMATNPSGVSTSTGLHLEVFSAPAWKSIANPPALAPGQAMAPIDLKLLVTGFPAAGITAMGALPPGVTLKNGVISGTPTAAGTYTLAFGAINPIATETSNPVTFSVGSPPTWGTIPAITTPPNVAMAGVDLHQYLSAGFPTPAITVDPSTPLPAGMTLVNGILGGTPTATGSQTLKFIATNSAGTATSADVTVSLVALPVWQTIPLQTLPPNAAMTSLDLNTLVSGSPTIALKAGDSLPTGLTLAAGVIAGTPTVVGAKTVGLTATNAAGTASANIVFHIETPALTITVRVAP